MLHDLPVRGDNDSDAVFALKLESHRDARGALSSQYGPMQLVQTGSVGWTGISRVWGEAMFCLMNSGRASNFEIGFVGNEKLKSDDSNSP